MMWKLLVFLFLSASSLLALPTGGELIQGQASVLSSTDSLQINANGKAILHWEDFSIASHEAVHFFQGEANQAILNRVTTSSVSELLGLLQANCPIYLINPNGVFIGNNASIDTAGFIASTADLSNEAFLQGKEFLFQELGSGKIVNLGKISALEGDVLLIARGIENRGEIAALNGIAMLTTREMMLNPDTKKCVFIRANAREEEIQNDGSIQALSVELHTNSFYEKAIQHTGSIEALAAFEQNGKIYLVAENSGSIVSGSLIAGSGEVRVLGERVCLEETAYIDASGVVGGIVLIGGDYLGSNPDILNAKETTISPGAEIHADAKLHGNGGKVIIWSDEATSYAGTISACGGALGGDGGFVEISAKSNDWYYGGIVSTRAVCGTTGTLLLDPSDITISGAATSQPFNPPLTYNPAGVASATLNATDLMNALATNNVTIATSNGTGGTTAGNVTFAASVTWASDHQLTVTADRSITLNSGVTVSSTFSGTPTNNPLINFTANAAVTSTGSFSGILISGSVLSTVDGNMSCVATGGDQNDNKGIYVLNGGIIRSTGNGFLSLIGTARTTGPGSNKEGIRIGHVTVGTISVVNGNLYLEAHGGSGGLSQGLEVNSGGAIRSTGLGNISILATSASTASNQASALVLADSAGGSVIEATGSGSIDIQAFGGGHRRFGGRYSFWWDNNGSH